VLSECTRVVYTECSVYALRVHIYSVRFCVQMADRTARMRLAKPVSTFTVFDTSSTLKSPRGHNSKRSFSQRMRCVALRCGADVSCHSLCGASSTCHVIQHNNSLRHRLRHSHSDEAVCFAVIWPVLLTNYLRVYQTDSHHIVLSVLTYWYT